jgi:Methyltransferase domain
MNSTRVRTWGPPTLLRSRLTSAAHLVFLNSGRHVSQRQLYRFRTILSYLEPGSWLAKEHPENRPDVVDDEFALFEIARSRIVGQAPLYLEFGVFEGRSMRWWSSNLTQPGATLVGFDSFEGLPEDWRPGFAAGQFRTGKPPQIHDSRVSFQVGWFEETLPRFTMPDHDQIILNIDADLYSSPATLLRWAEPFLCPGTLIYFDELWDRDHEGRARGGPSVSSGRGLCTSSSPWRSPMAARSGFSKSATVTPCHRPARPG